ncbi:MAG: restriction endonuclease [Acidimicrobiales bacterium]|nr:restriction endonuclease [Acidimicrobiales bacterium]
MQHQIDSGRPDAGSRGAATGGSQMTQLEDLLRDVLLESGLDESHIFTRTGLELPGYFRPEKRWDLLVVVDKCLLLVVEFKSQVGPSFGNNFNNRVEEAIGSAEDIWKAFHDGRFGLQPAPFVGYFFLLEDCPRVHEGIAFGEPHFSVDPALRGVSYAKRY